MAKHGFVFIDSADAVVEYSIDGGANWFEVTGPSGYSETGGDATTRTVAALKSAKQVSGKINPPTVSVNVVINPIMQWVDDLASQAEAGKAILLRVTTKDAEELLATTTGADKAAIAVDGTVTFAGTKPPFITSDDFSPGTILVIGTDKYVIDSITGTADTNAVVKVRPAPAAAVVSAVYSIENPQIRRPQYSAKMTSPVGLLTLAVDTEATSTINFAPQGQLPRAVVV